MDASFKHPVLLIWRAQKETAAWYVVSPAGDLFLAWEWSANGAPSTFQQEGYRWESVGSQDHG
jgi:hypothetical protein